MELSYQVIWFLLVFFSAHFRTNPTRDRVCRYYIFLSIQPNSLKTWTVAIHIRNYLIAEKIYWEFFWQNHDFLGKVIKKLIFSSFLIWNFFNRKFKELTDSFPPWDYEVKPTSSPTCSHWNYFALNFYWTCFNKMVSMVRCPKLLYSFYTKSCANKFY